MSDPRFTRTVGQILRVNYAGEYAAIRIYGAQIAISRVFHPSLLDFLSDTISHEQRHAARVLALMPPRDTRPCGATPLWGMAGSLLGLFTALLGRNGVMICTEAVERTVHAHLNEQLDWLGTRDPELTGTIIDIRDEEIGHQTEAQIRRSCYRWPSRLLDGTITRLTAILIWCSTYGASTRRYA